MIPINYSEAELCDIIIWRREGIAWEDVARKFNKKYGTAKSHDALRKTYNRYGSMYDISDEKLLLDTLKASVRKTVTSSKQAKESREILKAAVTFEEIFIQIQSMVKTLKVKPITKQLLPVQEKGKEMTMELLLGDVHAGLKYHGYDTSVATARVKELMRTFFEEVNRVSLIYNVEELILVMLGDMINSANMHGVESERDCDLSTPEQVAFVIKLLFQEVFIPLGNLGLKVRVPCIPGNHDRFEAKRTFVYPGKHALTWIIYNQLKELCAASGFDHITFEITEESFIVGEVYGDKFLWEHGDGVRGHSKQAIENHIQKRQVQVGHLIDFFRMGHIHEYKVFGRGRIIVNSSICGQTSFAKVLGYSSEASQTLNYYIKTKKRPTSFYKSFAVYLGG